MPLIAVAEIPATCAVVRAAISPTENPVIPELLMPAMSAACSTPICVPVRASTCAEVKPAVWVGVNATICAVVSAAI